MKGKPIHRRNSLISADQYRSDTGRFWLLPGLLTILVFFVGNTFHSMAATVGVFVFGLMVAGLFMQWSSIREVANTDEQPDTQTATITSTPSARSKQALLALQLERNERRRKRMVMLRKFALIPTVLIVSVGIASLRVIRHMAGILNPVAMTVDVVAHTVLFSMITLWVFYPRRGHPAI